MKVLKGLAWIAAATLLISVLGTPNTSAQGLRAAPPKAPGVTKAETYVVVQTGDNLSVVAKSEVNSLKKSAKDEYKQALKTYQDAKKNVGKNKDKIDLLKPPVERKVKVLPSPVFKTQEEAEAWMAKSPRERADSKTSKDAAAL